VSLDSQVEADLQAANDQCHARRMSVGSRRTCGSSPSSIFFPNASRSSRDLTSLAARVHSPTVGKRMSSCNILDLIPHKAEHRNSIERASKEDVWKLPTVPFRPLARSSSGSEPAKRPDTSSATPSTSCFEILSSMPERPLSSQSRKRFNKILGIKDEKKNNNTKQWSRSDHSLISNQLKKVDEVPDADRSVKSSIPLCSSLRTQEKQALDIDTLPEASDVTRCSYMTSPDKSTIESLLDKHIESLGLQPYHNDDGEGIDGEESIRSQHSTKNIIRISHLPLPEAGWNARRPVTSSSCNRSSLASAERRRLVPKRLFGSMDFRMVRSPLVGASTSTTKPLSETHSDHRSSSGWQTLPSSSQLVSCPSAGKPSLLSGELADIDSDQRITKFKLRRRSDMSSSPSLSSGHWSNITEGVRWTRETPLSPRRSRSETLARQASQSRRRTKIRSKRRRNSTILAELLDGAQRPDGTADAGQRKASPAHNVEEGRRTASPIVDHAQLSGDSSMAVRDWAMVTKDSSLPQPASFGWSSILATVPEPVEKKVESLPKGSVRKADNHRSNTTSAEPLNNTRLDTRVPRLGDIIPQLVPPDLEHPLTVLDHDLNVPDDERMLTAKPVLSGMKGLFLDDSSAQLERPSVRKRFHFHSLPSALRGSPVDTIVATNAAQSDSAHVNLSHSCRMDGRSPAEEYVPNNTVAMSDFAYRKRKVLERFKEWWKRQCVQKTFASKRKRSQRRVPGGLLV